MADNLAFVRFSGKPRFLEICAIIWTKLDIGLQVSNTQIRFSPSWGPVVGKSKTAETLKNLLSPHFWQCDGKAGQCKHQQTAGIVNLSKHIENLWCLWLLLLEANRSENANYKGVRKLRLYENAFFWPCGRPLKHQLESLPQRLQE